MRNSTKSTGSPLWRQVVDKTKTPEKKVVINEAEKKDSGKLDKKLDRKSLDRFDAHPKYHDDAAIRDKYNKLFPAVETKKTDDAAKASLTNSNKP